MGGREYLGCLIALAILAVAAGAPVGLVVGIVAWKLFGVVLVVGALGVVLAACIAGFLLACSFIDRIRRHGPD